MACYPADLLCLYYILINMTKTLYLIRHGQTEGNKEGLWLGAKSPHKLNSTGIDQAKQVAKILISIKY